VLGVDNSPLSIKICRMRGLRKARVMSITEVSRKLGVFDTIVMYGDNFGLFGSRCRAKWLLRRFHGMTSPGARIIAESNDPYQTSSVEHRQYHRFNRRRGRMPGQLRFRIRYRKWATPYFDYLLVSKDEMKDILRGTGWKVACFIDGKSSMYIADIDKKRNEGGRR